MFEALANFFSLIVQPAYDLTGSWWAAIFLFTLFSNAIASLNSSTDGIILQMAMLLGYTVALIFTVLRTGAVSKSIFNAH